MAKQPVPNSLNAGRIHVPANAKNSVWVHPVGRGMQLWKRADGDESDSIVRVAPGEDVRALIGPNQRREDLEIYLNDRTLALTNGDGSAPKKTAEPRSSGNGGGRSGGKNKNEKADDGKSDANADGNKADGEGGKAAG